MRRSGKKQFEPKEWHSVKRRYKYRCVRCSKKETLGTPLTADHVIPISMGGSRNIENIQPLCFQCNQAKGSDITDYRWRKFKT